MASARPSRVPALVLAALTLPAAATEMSLTCPPGEDGLQISCQVDPCMTTMCKAYPQATCEACTKQECPCCAIYYLDGEEVNCEDATPAMCESPCDSDYTVCPDGTTLYRYEELGCQFPSCPFCSPAQCCPGSSNGGKLVLGSCECLSAAEELCPYDCAQTEKAITKCECMDLKDVLPTFGECDLPLGVGLVDGTCHVISGCSLPEGLHLYESVEECQQVCHTTSCASDLKNCPCGTKLPRELLLECGFPLCPDEQPPQVMCTEGGDMCACDLADAFFGLCDQVLGFGIADGKCKAISGCENNIPDNVELFATGEACMAACPSALCPVEDDAQPVPCEQNACDMSEALCPRNPTADCVNCSMGTCSAVFHNEGVALSAIQCQCGCGDVNDDGELNVLDVVGSFQLVFEGKQPLSEGPSTLVPSVCGEIEVDVNKDAEANVLDLVTMVLMIVGQSQYPCH